MQYIVLIAALFLFGCTTTPVRVNEASNVPASRIYAYQNKSPEKTATIIAIRDSGFAGGGCYSAFYIDDILSGRFDIAEKATFYLNPGEHNLKLGPDPEGKGLCSAGSDYHFMKIETLLRQGETKTFNLRLLASGTPSIQRAD
jgi:hypothetical protein